MVNDSIGIDISKDKLDVFRLSDSAFLQVSNDEKGFAALYDWIGDDLPQRVVYEATGAYHKALEQHFCGHLPLVKVNPLNAKRFIQSFGIRAKTDRADAQALARMGAALALEADPVHSKDHHILRELQVTRLSLIKARVQAKIQLKHQSLPLTRKHTRARLSQLERQLTQLDSEIKTQLESDPERKAAIGILTSIPGVGRFLAHTILIEMPEIGTLTKKATAALTGVAPITRQSGTWQGKSFIRGGRKPLRDALYMPALNAIRYNPDMKRQYERLRAAGKPFKVAIVAVMRKLIILANTLVRDGRKWEKNHA